MATAITVPHSIVKQIKQDDVSILCMGVYKKEKIIRNVCLNKITEGGLGMVDLQAKVGSLRLS